jgi:hypothetical protein
MMMIIVVLEDTTRVCAFQESRRRATLPNVSEFEKEKSAGRQRQ